MVKHKDEEKVVRFNLRLPKTLHERLVKKAIAERRSLNDQLIYFLSIALKVKA